MKLALTYGLVAMKKSSGMLAAVALAAACSGEPAVEMRSSVAADEEGSAAVTTETAAEAGTAADPTLGADAAAPAQPAAGGTIQTREVDATPGLVAELIEATRKDGVLTIKVRFRNVGSEQLYKSFETDHGDYSRFYLTAGDQKFFVLKDSEGAPLAPQYLRVQLEPNQTMTWWAKFPAPAGQATFDLVMPDLVPFEDVPIRDA